jgi:hypothetical protein
METEGVLVGVTSGVVEGVLVGVTSGVVDGVMEGVIEMDGVGVGTYVYTEEERVGIPPDPFCCVNMNLYGLILSYDCSNS